MCTEYDETERCCLYISRKKEKTASTDDILVFHYSVFQDFIEAVLRMIYTL